MEKNFGKWSYAVAIVFGLFVGAFVGLVVGSSLSGVLAGVMSAAAATWLGAIDWSKVVAPIRMKIKYMPKSNLTPRLKAVGMALLGFAKGIMMVIYWIIYAVLYVAISPLRYIYRIFTNKEIRTMFYVSFLYPAIFATTIGAILLTDCFGLAEPWNACAVALLCVLGIIVLLEDGGLITLIWQHFEVATFTKKALEDWFDHDSQSCEPLEMALRSKHPPFKAVCLLVGNSLANVGRLYWFIAKMIFWAPVKLFTYKTGASIITSTALSTIHLGTSHCFGWIEAGSLNYVLLLCVCMIVGGVAGRKIHDLRPFTVTLPKYKYIPYETI